MTANAVAKREPTNFELALAEYEPQIAAVLPLHIPAEKFRRVVITAVNLNPDLLKADRRSLFTACVRAAADGLYPDGREAALVMFGTQATYMPMIHGIRKRMRNTGEVTAADAQIVHQNDDFSYELGDTPHIHHKPALSDRGPAIGAYAIIKLTNGEIIREYMPLADIEKVRNVSRAKNSGPWTTWWSEMARKTVLRRASKAAPTSPEIDVLLRRDDDLPGGDEPARLPPPRPSRASVHIVESAEPEKAAETKPEPIADHDEETGEVHSDVVLETLDATTPAKAEPLPPSLFTVWPVYKDDGSTDYAAMLALFKGSVSKADTLEILDEVTNDNWGAGRLLTALSEAPNKATYKKVVEFVNARKSEIMAARSLLPQSV